MHCSHLDIRFAERCDQRAHKRRFVSKRVTNKNVVKHKRGSTFVCCDYASHFASRIDEEAIGHFVVSASARLGLGKGALEVPEPMFGKRRLLRLGFTKPTSAPSVKHKRLSVRVIRFLITRG
jgi:hypothetical protein